MIVRTMDMVCSYFSGGSNADRSPGRRIDGASGMLQPIASDEALMTFVQGF